MRPQFLLKQLLLSTTVIALLLTISCSKKPERIGDNLQPDQNNIQLFYTDTVSIVAYSVAEDSIRTDSPTNILFGSMKDPVFGTTIAGFFTQIRLSTNGHNFGTNPQLDSLVLQLAYSGHYGDTTAMQTMRVYELKEDINIDSAYYSNRSLSVGETDFASNQFAPLPKTPFPFRGDTLAPLIRVPLTLNSTALGEKILTASESDLESTAKFKEYFKGLYITADPVATGGAISYFDLPSNLSRLTIYYSNDSDDSLRYDFYITSSDARFNRFDHNEFQDASPDFVNQVVQGDTLAGKQKLYAQAMSGIKTKILFPNITKMQHPSGQKMIVNEAKLIMYASDLAEEYGAPSQMALVLNDGNKAYQVLPDQREGDDYFGGKYKSSIKGYQYRITRHIQEMILAGETKENYGLYFLVYGASSKADRWVFNGISPINDSLKPLKLQLTYSIVNE
ncbi:MAG: DUF4270 domain-containing protein [Bacteroidales bacterium]|nr:DUF4270 domain-containing protein [Bacteroidales bacterium]